MKLPRITVVFDFRPFDWAIETRNFEIGRFFAPTRGKGGLRDCESLRIRLMRAPTGSYRNFGPMCSPCLSRLHSA